MRIGVEDQRTSEPADMRFRRQRTEKMGKMGPVLRRAEHKERSHIGWFEDK
jgi:hypothetical protein